MSYRAIAVVLLASCAGTLEIGALEPRPQIDGPALAELGLELGPSVADSFAVDAGSSGTIRVRQWRATLAAAFRNGGGDRRGAEPRAIVRIEKAELELVADRPDLRGALASRSTRVAHGNHGTPKVSRPPPPRYARIDFSASLIDPASGAVVARASGVVVSPRQARSTREVAAVVSDGVGRLFERLSVELPLDPSGARRSSSRRSARPATPP